MQAAIDMKEGFEFLYYGQGALCADLAVFGIVIQADLAVDQTNFLLATLLHATNSQYYNIHSTSSPIRI